MKRIKAILQSLWQQVMASDIGRRMATGAFWSFSGTILAKFIVLLAGIACAHVLGQEEYGEFNMVRSTIYLFVVFGVAGLGLTATKFISEYRKTDKEHIGSIYILTNGFAFITGTLVTSIILITAPYLSSVLLNAPHLLTPIRVGAFLLFVTVLNGAQQGTLAGFEDFRSIAFNTFLGNLSESVLMLVGGYLYGVTGAVLGFGVGFIVLYICNNVAIHKDLKANDISWHLRSFRRSDLNLLYRFSLPAALASFLVAPVFWCARTMLVQKEGFGELAIYEAAEHWRVVILFIPAAVSQVVLPILSSIVHEGKERFWKVLHYNILLNASIALVLALGICLFSSIIMGFYGKGFVKPEVLILMALSTIFNAVSSVVGLSIYSRAKMWTSFSFNLLWGIMMISFSYIFLQRGMGATGVALSMLCSYIILSTIQYIYLWKSVHSMS